MTVNGDRPRYRGLRGRVGYPDRSSWGLWGEGDEIGALNDVPAQCVARAAGLVSRGSVFAPNWRADLPSPGLFGRGPMRHTIRDDGFAMDDYYDCFWPQQSSQWDASLHADLLALLGVGVGELWFLDELARDNIADGRYTGLLVSAAPLYSGRHRPLANAIALK